ncbi:phosphoribosyl-dephospho-CoA transferase [Acrocarpospora phusangensis]|uniref:Phosphoribosyl-dephospho-CoA transferase n=2 Tax=Acrocarpospora phusangensis TaxID=1070424 RepID=A0A919QBI0_9ACTN|nr:phosphoribosyl-dephospho-CoA transferase [Acrocarpospora phusangensis]
MTPHPHDLVQPRPGTALGAAPPGWVAVSLAACPWVVVRRAPHPPGLVPVGVRGISRGQRYAGFVPAAAVVRGVPPEELRGRRPRHSRLAATMSAVAALLDGEAVWGPTGSVGFELATGHPVTRPGSDLDLVIRAPRRMSPAFAKHLLDAFSALPSTVDCQLDTPCGGISLAEWAGIGGPLLTRTGGVVLARTSHGPKLVDDPWSPE